MAPSLDSIQPAPSRDVNVYLPYFQGAKKRDLLPVAVTLYQGGSLEGKREIEGGEAVPFVATWNVSNLPADLARCRLQFDGDPDLNYEITITNFEFIDFLIEVLTNYRRTRVADFPKGFYRKLLKMDD